MLSPARALRIRGTTQTSLTGVELPKTFAVALSSPEGSLWAQTGAPLVRELMAGEMVISTVKRATLGSVSGRDTALYVHCAVNVPVLISDATLSHTRSRDTAQSSARIFHHRRSDLFTGVVSAILYSSSTYPRSIQCGKR